MTTAALSSQPSFLKKKLFIGITPSILIILAIMLLSLGLHLYNIDSIGDANAYYTAAVKSMLGSWSNFFFIAAEPGGSVTVDKPPLGLWIEAAFAYFLGVSGFSVSLPNIIAGVLSIPLLYGMVKKYGGELAGIVAAFVMSITPVFLATNRNNTMDGILVFVLLLAAWAFIKATESGRLRWLLLGAFGIGLGFNIKMMQAFLPLPAFYALYFFGSKEGWLLKITNLSLATILLIAVSLSWAAVVDLTPADSRPYIGSSENNTVMGLIFGHNGISRLESTGGPGGNSPQNGQTPLSAPQADSTAGQSTQPQQGTHQGVPQEALDACANSTQGSACSFTAQNGNTIDGSCVIPPNSSQLACAPQGMIGQNGQIPNGGPSGQGGITQFSRETGDPSVFRFFTNPLSKQMSWLLPFALISVLLALFAGKIQLPLENTIHKALILWGGWLLTCVVFFSMVSGIFHAYYATMLAAPLGAMVGMGFSQLWDWSREKGWAAILLIAASLVTLGFQFFATYQYNEWSWWMLFAGALFVAGISLMVAKKRLAFMTLLASMMVIPMYWTVMTVVVAPDINLPTAYQGGNQQAADDRARDGQADGPGSGINDEMLAYLEANTVDVKYLVAVPSSQQGSRLVLATGRPVLFIGGFNGEDEVVTADALAALVANGELRYVLYGDNRSNNEDITNWLKSSCSVMLDFSDANSDNSSQPGPGDQSTTLYMCR